jgi:formamidopyrimidine-DNA glycosylase
VTKVKPDPDIHNRLFLELSDHSFLNFLDIRRFGTFHLIKDRSQYPGLHRLGMDALNSAWTGELFFNKLQLHKKSVYSCLLDQSIISGVGNIYANEALFLSKINPLRAANRLTVMDSKKLLHSVIDILSTALQFQGTTLIDNSYKDSEGKSGNFRKLLKVYGRTGEVCVTCDTPITRIRVGNRSVYFCPHCQRK